MPLDFKHAASTMIDAGASDEDIRTTIDAMRQQAAAMMDKGADDASIESALSGATWAGMDGRASFLFPSKLAQKQQAAAANAALNPTAPRQRSVMETITGVPGAIGRGIIGAIPSAVHFVADTARKIPDLGTPAPVPYDQPIPSKGTQVLENLKDVARGPINLAKSIVGIPRPPDVLPNPGREARERFGELLTLPPVFKGGTALFRAPLLGFPGLGPAAARIATAATMGGAQAVPSGDPLQIIESATSMGTLGGLGEGLGAGARLAGRGVGKGVELAQAANLLKGDALLEQSKALGGGQGVMQEIVKQGAQPLYSRMPEVLTTLEESGQTLQNAGRLAAEKVRAQSSAMRQEAINLAPKDATVPNSFVGKMQTMVDDGSTVLQSATERKLHRLAAELDTTGAGPALTLGGKSLAGAPPELLERIKAVLPPVNEGITFEKLTNLREDLNRLPAFDDFSRRLVGLAVKAVDSDIAQFGKKFPEPVRAYNEWKDFYAREVGAYHGEGAPLRILTDTEFGRPKMPYSEKIPELVAMAPENIRSAMAAIRKGPAGKAAVDDIQAGVAQHLRELVIDQATGTTNPQALLKQFGNPKDIRRWREALGPRFDPYYNLAKELRSAGVTMETGAVPGAVHFWPTFHAMRGAMMAVGGNPVGAMYHLSTAGSMTLFPAVFEKIASNRAGAKLLAAGILEKPGTPRAGVIQENILRRAAQETKKDPRLLMPPPEGPGSQVSGGAPGDRPFWRPPVINMGETAAPEGFRIPNAPPALTKDTVRLYRIDAPTGKGLPDWIKQDRTFQGTKAATGRWFTDDPAKLDFYLKDAGPGAKVSSVEVPRSALEQYRVSNNPDVRRYSADPVSEFFVPPDVAKSRTGAPALNMPLRRNYGSEIRQGPPEVRQLPGSVADAKDMVNYARYVARQGGPIEPSLMEALHGIAQSQSVPFELRNTAGRIIKANFAKYPESQAPTIPLKYSEIPVPPSAGPLLQGVGKLEPGAAATDVGATTGRKATPKQLKMEEYAQQYREANAGAKIEGEQHPVFGPLREAAPGGIRFSSGVSRETLKQLNRDAPWLVNKKGARADEIANDVFGLASEDQLVQLLQSELKTAGSNAPPKFGKYDPKLDRQRLELIQNMDAADAFNKMRDPMAMDWERRAAQMRWNKLMPKKPVK